MADGPNPYARPTAYRYGGGADPRPETAGNVEPTPRGPRRPTNESARSVVTGSPLAAPGAASVIPSLPTRPQPESRTLLTTPMAPPMTALPPPRPLPPAMRRPGMEGDESQAPLRPIPPAMRRPTSPVMGAAEQPLAPLEPQSRAPLPDAIPEPVIIPDPISDPAQRAEPSLMAPIPGSTVGGKAPARRSPALIVALGLVVLAVIGLAAVVYVMTRAKAPPQPAPAQVPSVQLPITPPVAPPVAAAPAPVVAPEPTPAPAEAAPTLRGSQPKPTQAPTPPAAKAVPAKPPASAKPTPTAAAPPSPAPAPAAPPPSLDFGPGPIALPPPQAAKPPPPKLTPAPAPRPSNPDGPISTGRPG